MKTRTALVGVLVVLLSVTSLRNWADNLGQKADANAYSPRRVLLGDAWPGIMTNDPKTNTNDNSPKRMLLSDAWLVSETYDPEANTNAYSPRRVLLGDAF